MPYLIDSASDIVFIRQYGQIAADEMAELHDSLVGLTADRGYRDVLIDTRDATWLASQGDVLAAVERAADIQVYGRIALVMPVRYRDMAEFIDTACRHHGLNVGVFYDPDTALGWLRPGPARRLIRS